ncbi:DUF2934 domain-containing protein [Bradyrhizobium sp.]|uniref:DUF2934 domain-containing protein n=1 Tax=Bradyrhizobium sp. TaxID=376 RepID=UPI003C784973
MLPIIAMPVLRNDAVSRIKRSLTLREQDFACRGWAYHVRECAYHLWVAGGQPEGQADIYWFIAQLEILTTSVESEDSNTAAAATTDTGSVATKPGKKTSVTPIGKSKTRAA